MSARPAGSEAVPHPTAPARPAGHAQGARNRRDADRTRRDILLAAMHEFSEYGDSGARIDRIAERANANKALIYAYFGNKETLYGHVLREAYVQIRSGERTLELGALPPAEAIRALIRFTMQHFLDAPWFLRLLATENLRRGQTIREIEDIAEIQSPLIEQISLVLDKGVETEAFRSDVEAEHLYIMIASLFFFPFSNTYTLGRVFGAPIDDARWREKHLGHVEEMVLAFLAR